MKNKGFTLIELLAVIVILAIIALIAVPIVLNIIEDAKNESNQRSIDLYGTAVKNAAAKYQLNYSNTDLTGKYDSNKEGTELTHQDTDKDITLTVEYDGSRVYCETIEIYEDGEIYLDKCQVNGNSVDNTYGEVELEAGLYDENDVMIMSWNELLENNMLSVSSAGALTVVDKSVLVGKLIISNTVTSMEFGMFQNCTGLTSITIPDSVTSIGAGIFINCSNLETIVVDEKNTVYDSRDNSNAIIETATNKLVAGCRNTIIPENVTSINAYAFDSCTGLTSITIPDSVTSIGYMAYSGCTNLTNVKIGKGVTSIGSYAFGNCNNLEKITVDEKNTVYDSRNNSNAIIETATNTLVVGCKNTIIPENIISIGSSAFDGCTGLTSITIPSSVTSIGVTAFSGCTGLTSITIPENVTSIDNYAFSGCTGLTNIIIPNKVKTIGNGAFSGCTGLTSIYISESVTSLSSFDPYYPSKTSDSRFYGCSSTLKIYSGASSKPSGWNQYWNYYDDTNTLSVEYGVTQAQYETIING